MRRHVLFAAAPAGLILALVPPAARAGLAPPGDAPPTALRVGTGAGAEPRGRLLERRPPPLLRLPRPHPPALGGELGGEGQLVPGRGDRRPPGNRRATRENVHPGRVAAAVAVLPHRLRRSRRRRPA